ncbi:hypothetical protein DUNSADRAFT_14045 [Dunaliella salina]|uniref:Uncharacterized protein n=1 Tax=Dunaliella salina TaxID=3046 RepID=A0ABQ7G872_DUNSA|nr:hypothetical protein DUNSADRAFT_14045 [Dunaliella salina]|eukprot:KAF5830796.1 hypothetical protein DUNSADRAFT_14045 [Dunaliella salina]
MHADGHPVHDKKAEEAADIQPVPNEKAENASVSQPVLDRKAEQAKFLETVTARYFPEHTLITETSEYFREPPVWPPGDPRKAKAACSPLYDVDELYKAYKRAVEEDDADPMGLFGKAHAGRTSTIPPAVHLTQQLRAQLASRSRHKGTHGLKKPGDVAAPGTPEKPQTPVSPLPLKQAGLGHPMPDMPGRSKEAPGAAHLGHGTGPSQEGTAGGVADSVRARRAQAQLSFRPDTNLGSSPPSTNHKQRQQQLQQGLFARHTRRAAELQPPYSKASLPLPPVDHLKNAHGKQQPPSSNGVQLVVNAPSIAPGGRGVHPFFLLGVLQHGLSGSPSAVITGTRTRKSHAAAVPPIGWGTAELVANCVQPALGATRLSYVQALACNAAEVPWCPYGRFAPGVSPVPLKPGVSALQHHGHPPQSSPAATLPSHSHAAASSSSSNSSSSSGQSHQQQCQSVEVQLSGGGTSVPLPADIAGKSAYGNASYFLSHPWSCRQCSRQRCWEQKFVSLREAGVSGPRSAHAHGMAPDGTGSLSTLMLVQLLVLGPGSGLADKIEVPPWMLAIGSLHFNESIAMIVAIQA